MTSYTEIGSEPGVAFQALFEGALDAVCLVDSNRVYVAVNQAACELFALPRETLIGKRIDDLVVGLNDHPAEVDAAWQEFLATGTQAGEAAVRRPDGSLRWVDFRATAQVLPDRHMSILRDVTEKRETAARIEEHDRALTTLIGNLPGVVYRFLNDGEFNVRFMDGTVREITGYAPEDFLSGRVRYADLIHPDHRSCVAEALAHGLQSKARFQVTYRIVAGDDSERWVWDQVTPVFANGEPLAFEGFVIDITKRVQLEDRLTGLTEAAIAIGSAVSIEAVGEIVTGTVRRLMGASAGTLHLDAPNFAAMKGSAGSLTAALKARDGAAFGWVEVSQKERGEFTFEDKAVLRQLAQSASAAIENLRLNASLTDSEQRYRFLADAVPTIVWTALPDGRLDYVNSRATAFFGRPVEELLGYEWAASVHPDDREAVLERWGSALATGAVYEMEARFARAGGGYHWLLVRATSYRDPSGEILKWFGTCTDIEDQKRIEGALRRANDDLNHFAYSASHDLQEPLRMISLYTELLQKRYGQSLDEDAREYISQTVNGASRMQALIRDLLEYTRLSTLEPGGAGPIDCNAIVGTVLVNLNAAISAAGATVETSPLPQVPAEKVHLVQLLQNLVGNGIKYRSNRPPLIRISAVDRGDRWEFSVRDNGIGIKEAYAAQVFGLFRRLHTAAEYPGTGIGLAICERIVERYGGRIWVESEEGVGSDFRFTLPHA